MVNKYKQIQLKEVKERLQKATNMIFIDFNKCSANNITSLRLELKKNKLGMFVLKNSLALLAFRQLNAPDELLQKLNGQNAIIYGDDPVVISRILVNFLEKKPVVKIKYAYFEGKIFDKSVIDMYAKYNSKNDLVAILISRIKQPILSLIFDLKYIVAKFVNVLKEIEKKK